MKLYKNNLTKNTNEDGINNRKSDFKKMLHKQVFEAKNYLNNRLLQEIIKLIHTFLRLNLLNVSSIRYMNAIPNLIFCLEFFFKNPIISKAVYDMREENYKKKLEKKKKNVVISGFNEIKVLLKTVVMNVTELTKDLAGTIFLGSFSHIIFK